MNRSPAGITATSGRGSLFTPDITARRFEYLFGVDGPTSFINRHTGIVDAVATGSPTFGAAYMDCSGNSGAPKGATLGETPPVDSDYFFMVAHTKPSAIVAILANTGTNSVGETVTHGLHGSSTQIIGRNSQLGAGGLAALNLPTMTTEFMISFAWGRIGDFARVQHWSAGALSPITTATTPGRTTRAAAPALLNLALPGAGSGTFKIAFAAGFSEIKNAAWRTAAAQRTQKQLVGRSLTLI